MNDLIGKLDKNKDGKVNFEDFIAGVKDILDLDNDGKVEIVEIITVIKNILTVL